MNANEQLNNSNSKGVISEINVVSFKQFLTQLSNIIPEVKVLSGEPYRKEIGRQLGNIGIVYRGHSDSDWTLTPAALRSDSITKMNSLCANFPNSLGSVSCAGTQENKDLLMVELQLLKNFYITANMYGLALPEFDIFSRVPNVNLLDFFVSKFFDNWSWYYDSKLENIAALAQHYGVPTRMLDWSYDLDVALYFAAKGAINNIMNNTIPKSNNTAIFLMGPDLGAAYPEMQIITPQYAQNPNLRAQRGLFVYWRNLMKEDIRFHRLSLDKHIEEDPPEHMQSRVNKDRFNLWGKGKILKFNIPYSEIHIIWHYLLNKGCSASKYFPGYQSVAEEMKEWEMLANLSKSQSMDSNSAATDITEHPTEYYAAKGTAK
ncbi:FRG domain-containing protein [Breznakiellaceae bacterium SP9]